MVRRSRAPGVFPGATALVAVIISCFMGATQAQESMVFLNEIIASNDDRPPADIGDGHPDMIELYNAGSEPVDLGGSGGAAAMALSDTLEYCEGDAWRFPVGSSVIPAGGFLTIFCDENEGQATCELHATFRIANDGSEPVTLWGAADSGGNRAIVDQVWLLPLPDNHSFGRFPDGAGPRPVSVEETLDWFHVFLPSNTTFGSCSSIPGTTCMPEQDQTEARRQCLGSPNRPGDNLAPKIGQEAYTTNAPAAGEAADFVVRVEDDKDPTPGNIASVQIRYSVDGVEQPPIDLTFDAGSGVLAAGPEGPLDPDRCNGVPDPGRPLERWSLWNGSIPGLPAGSRVDFEFYVEDSGGLSDSSPGNLCAEGVGPCDSLGLPGPGCVPEPDCTRGCQFQACDVRRQYRVGYAPAGPLSSVLINEVVAAQTRLLRDTTQDCGNAAPGEPCGFEDFIELINTSSEAVDLSGLWLSDRPFHPQGWKFPPDSVIQPGEYLIVWTDNDGGKCPRPPEVQGDGQECPDPTAPMLGRYHTDFNLDAAGDQIFLFEEIPSVGDAGIGFGVVHGHAFPAIDPNDTWELRPNGGRGGELVRVPGGSPGAANGPTDAAVFKRGDTNGDCAIDLGDAVFLLNFLFVGGPALPCPDGGDADDNGRLDITDPVYSLNFQFLDGPLPPDPGPDTPGGDPTEDTLGPCAPSCEG